MTFQFQKTSAFPLTRGRTVFRPEVHPDNPDTELSNKRTKMSGLCVVEISDRDQQAPEGYKTGHKILYS